MVVRKRQSRGWTAYLYSFPKTSTCPQELLSLDRCDEMHIRQFRHRDGKPTNSNGTMLDHGEVGGTAITNPNDSSPHPSAAASGDVEGVHLHFTSFIKQETASLANTLFH
jgi:hypothetical protein